MYQFSSKSRQQSKNYDQTLLNGRRSYNFQNMKASTQLSQTDKRIQQIKRKYDTPNRRERMSHLSNKKSDINLNKQNENFGTADFKSKSILYPNSQLQRNQNGLKQSKNLQNYDSKSILRNSRQKVYNNQYSNSKNTLVDKISKQADNYDPKNGMNKLYKNQNQEQFFKRVKQMKQSLLYGQNSNKTSNDIYHSKYYGQNNHHSKNFNEFSTNNNQMKVSGYAQSRQSRTMQSAYDTANNIQKDRIDNIDKINQKIKGILECLNMNQKSRNPTKYVPDIEKRSRIQNIQKSTLQFHSRQNLKTPIKNNLNMGRQTFGNIHRHQKSQLLEKIQINNIKNLNSQDEKWQKLSSKLQKYEFETKIRNQKALQNSKQPQIQTSQNKFYQRNSCYYQQPPSSKTNEFIRRDNKSVDFKDLRSKSFIHPNVSNNIKQVRDRSVNLREAQTPKQYQMRSGKKLDDQIGRIQKKIQQFQQQKKRLNIQFKPFAYSNCKSTSNLLTNQRYQPSDKKISQFTKNLYKDQNSNQQKQKNQKVNLHLDKKNNKKENKLTNFKENYKKIDFKAKYKQNQRKVTHRLLERVNL